MNIINNPIKLLIMVLSISILLVGCSHNSDTIDNNLQYIEDSTTQKTKVNGNNDKTENIVDDNVVTIGAISYPPNYYFENGEFKGPVSEIIVEAFNRVGVEFEIKEYPWARLLNLTELGEVDAIIDIYISEERLNFLDFSSEKLISYNDAFFKLADSDIKFNGDFNNLTNYKIGSVQGFYYGNPYDKAVKEGILKAEEIPTFEGNIEKLLNLRIDLVVSAVSVGKTAIDELGYSDIIVPIKPYINTEHSYVGFSKVNNLMKLKNQYDETIREMHEDGTIKAIYKKYGISEY